MTDYHNHALVLRESNRILHARLPSGARALLGVSCACIGGGLAIGVLSFAACCPSFAAMTFVLLVLLLVGFESAVPPGAPVTGVRQRPRV